MPCDLKSGVSATCSRVGAAILVAVLYQALHNHALENKKLLYNVKPKCHYYDHVVTMLTKSLINPRFTECWHGESMCRYMSNLLAECDTKSKMAASIHRYVKSKTAEWFRGGIAADFDSADDESQAVDC